MSVGVEFRVFGKAAALDNIRRQNLNDAAYLGFQEQFFSELKIPVVEAGSKNPGKHDGREEALAQLGQLSAPAAAALVANEIGNARG